MPIADIVFSIFQTANGKQDEVILFHGNRFVGNVQCWGLTKNCSFITYIDRYILLFSDLWLIVILNCNVISVAVNLFGSRDRIKVFLMEKNDV
jgi:hypothetical protein